MKMPFGLLALACLSLSLSSCADNQAESVPSSSVYQWSLPIGDLPSSSSSAESRRGTSTAVAPSSESSAAPEPSSSSVVYCTVSIYQSYYIREKGCYGDPRFDTSVKREDGQVLYKDAKEQNALFAVCGPTLHHIIGGWYEMNGFYKDEWCTDYISWAFVVKADLSIYYYCE